MGVLGTTTAKQEVVSSHALQLLVPLLGPQAGPDPCIMEWDSLGYVLALTMALPGLFGNDSKVCPIPVDPQQARHIFHLVLLSQIVKVMVSCNLTPCIKDTDMEVEYIAQSDWHSAPHGNKTLMDVLKRLRTNVDTADLDVTVFWNTVQSGCKAFLRGCCLFYHFLMDAEPSEYLTYVGTDTFENMCSYLGLPTSFDQLFYHPVTLSLASNWMAHPEMRWYLNGQNSSLTIIKEPRMVCRLVALPNDYSELINAVSLFICPNSDREDSRNPTMCLVCGDMLCSQSYCCQMDLKKSPVGACTYHSHVCGSGVGVFLRVRECEVLLLAAPSKGCVVSPPYVDEYGETDQGLRRGNPLRLCQETYNKLQMLWLSHGIHEEIARNIESNNNLMTTTWQHL